MAFEGTFRTHEKRNRPSSDRMEQGNAILVSGTCRRTPTNELSTMSTTPTVVTHGIVSGVIFHHHVTSLSVEDHSGSVVLRIRSFNDNHMRLQNENSHVRINITQLH